MFKASTADYYPEQVSGYIKGQDDGADICIRVTPEQITVTRHTEEEYTAKMLPLKQLAAPNTIKTRPTYIGTSRSIKDFLTFLADPTFDIWTTAMITVILLKGRTIK